MNGVADITAEGQLIDPAGQFRQLLVVEIARDARAIRGAIGKDRDTFLRIAGGRFANRPDHVTRIKFGLGGFANLEDLRRTNIETEGPDRLGIKQFLVLILNIVQKIHNIGSRQRIARAQGHGMRARVIADRCFALIVIRLQDDGQRLVAIGTDLFIRDLDGIAARTQEPGAGPRCHRVGKHLVFCFRRGGEDALHRKQVMRRPKCCIAIILGGQIDHAPIRRTDVLVKGIGAHQHHISNPQVDAGLRVQMVGHIRQRERTASVVLI